MAPFLLCILLLLSCNNNQQVSAPGAETVQAGHTDDKIVRIAEDARNTLPIFFRHLTGPGKGEHSFSVKYPFRADDNSGIDMEHIWLTGIRFKNGQYYGILAGAPRYLGGMKKGDTVAFSADSITDWMYIRDDRIIGGYSIKYLLEKIPEDQRSGEQKKLLLMFD